MANHVQIAANQRAKVYLWLAQMAHYESTRTALAAELDHEERERQSLDFFETEVRCIERAREISGAKPAQFKRLCSKAWRSFGQVSP